jgi:hypothetical protein
MFPIIGVIMMGCGSLNYVRESKWKYVEGYHVGDLLNFNHTQQFKLDNRGRIYVKGKYSGKVIDYTKSDLIIESNKGRKGFYVIFD